jgi:hypothetical protein
MFRLTAEEFSGLRSQIATSNFGRGGRRYPSQVFTEHGALMAATILNCPRAIEVSVYVVRAFVQLRDLLAGNKELAQRLRELERRLEGRLAGGQGGLITMSSSLMPFLLPIPEAFGPVNAPALAEGLGRATLMLAAGLVPYIVWRRRQQMLRVAG